MTLSFPELAFANRQLAGMLRDGIPLERGLQQLCLTMHSGSLKMELTSLEQDLARGRPLAEALEARQLPKFYVAMLKVGARTGDMAGTLILLADYYEAANMTWTRLKGLMVYPILVLLTSLGLALWMSMVMGQLASGFAPGSAVPNPAWQTVQFTSGFMLWLPPTVVLCLFVLMGWALLNPSVRHELSWRLPSFKEANLARVASAMGMLLNAGCPLGEAIALLENLEKGTPVCCDLGLWRKRCMEGHGRFQEIAVGSKVFPPLFLWMVAGSGEDMASGFKNVARLYQERAAYRAEMLLYAFLPTAILILGLMIFLQLSPVARVLFGLNRLFSI
jgi:type II secretory pathway component PulF